MKARPEEQLSNKQTLHDPLHLAESGREALRIVREGFDESRLKYVKVKQIVH